jgi:hypothetical protein
MKQGDCDLCGEWTGALINGACPDCRSRLKLDDPPHPTTKLLEDQVRFALGEIYPLPEPPVLGHILSEALWQIHQELQRGEMIDLEHIGKIYLQTKEERA